MKLDVSYIIPVYNNQDSLVELVEQIHGLWSIGRPNIIFVNDCSTDQSLEIIKDLSLNFENINYLSFSRNFGQVPAIVAGMKHSASAINVVVSADLQDPIEVSKDMIQLIQEGESVCIGYREDRDESISRRFFSRVFYSLMRISNKGFPVGGFDYFALDRVATENYNRLDERNRFLQGDVLYLGFNPKFIPYKRLERKYGTSMWGFWKKFKYFIDGLINTSYSSIRLATFLGFLSAFLGFTYAVVIIYLRIVQKVPFKGWAPIMVLLLVLGGVILIMLGLIGEYIWRIYDETRKRPYYIIEETNLIS